MASNRECVPPEKDLPALIIVGVTCCLSILGAFVIICSYVFFKELRTPARLVLAHLSLMDLGIAVAHLSGVIMADIPHSTNGIANNITCVAQATFTAFFTLSSFFWTGYLAVYMYFRIVHVSNDKIVRRMIYCSYIACYGAPLLLTIWFLATNKLGRTWFSGGWCGLIISYPDNPCKYSIFVAIFGFDLWAYITFMIATVLYISVHIHIHYEFTRSRMFVSSLRFWTAFQNVDYKFLLIPIAFILLRVWSCIMTIIVVYCDCKESVNTTILSALHYLVGIGDSGQGFINAILFVVFTKTVRQRLLCRTISAERSPLIQNNRETHGGGKAAIKDSSLTVISSHTSNINY